MPTCPHCGANVPEGAVYCGNCGGAISSPSSSMSSSPQSQPSSQVSTTWPSTASSGDMSARLEKAMRRAELLGYAAVGLAVVIFVVLIILSL